MRKWELGVWKQFDVAPIEVQELAEHMRPKLGEHVCKVVTL
jgi:hypothetical protein